VRAGGLVWCGAEGGGGGGGRVSARGDRLRCGERLEGVLAGHSSIDWPKCEYANMRLLARKWQLCAAGAHAWPTQREYPNRAAAQSPKRLPLAHWI
jgi:hypothetical protein